MSTPISFSPPITTTTPPPPSSVPYSVIIVIIIIASSVIVTVSIYLILKFLSKRFHRSFRNDVVHHSNSNHSSIRHVAPIPILDSLPLFTFSSVSGNLTGGDCAVCLSSFEPHDKLRLLPLCCHAFHCQCIDTWISTNQTCPLCRSTAFPSESDILEKFQGGSFRVEIGSVSRRHGSGNENGNEVIADTNNNNSNVVERTYSIGGSFEYIVNDGYEISLGSMRRVGSSFSDKEEEVLAGEVGGGGGRSWLREYVDRASSRALSFRGSGRFFSSRRREEEEDLEGNYRAGEEISELFRWLSGV